MEAEYESAGAQVAKKATGILSYIKNRENSFIQRDIKHWDRLSVVESPFL